MTSITRTFTVDELEALGIPNKWTATEGQAAEHLHEEQIDTRRWASTHQLVFRVPGDTQAWAVTYQRPLTEHQEADPWFGDDEVTATAMEERQVTITRWEPASNKTTQDGAR